MVDVLDHELNMHPPLNPDLLQVLRQVRDRPVHIQVSEKVWCVENLLPTELQLVSLLLIDEEQMSE